MGWGVSFKPQCNAVMTLNISKQNTARDNTSFYLGGSGDPLPENFQLRGFEIAHSDQYYFECLLNHHVIIIPRSNAVQ